MALDEIVTHKRAEVAARREALPLKGFAGALEPSRRSLELALRRRRTGFILECKGASPSQGILRDGIDLPAVIAAYGPHADAVSVLTDERYFGGSFARLHSLAAGLHVPVLCKDFVVEPYQVFEARRHGADAVLLMLSVLDDAAYRACHEAAVSLGLDVLTEAHTEAELDRALALGARIIGINNRDLRTLQVDLGVTERLAPRVPGDRLVISESGIGSHADTRRLRHLVDGFLVGTSLMRQPDLAHATRALVHGYTKVCGLTRPADAAAAAALGATHGGMILARESPRYVDPSDRASLRAAAGFRWVGVFVNAPVEEVAGVAEALDLSAVQLHGEEDRDAIVALRARFGGRREVWKAVRVRDGVPRVDQVGADRLVLDTYAPGARGGTGRRFDWRLLRDYPDLGRVVLGGGLTPEAVPAAEAVGAWGLDVNSGVERRPGEKDPGLLAAFLDARRGIGRQQGVTR